MLSNSFTGFIQRFPPYLIAFTSFVVVLTFIGLGQYAHPSADDFCMATGIRHEGLLAHLWNHYFEWSGRYSGNAFYAVFPLIFGMFDGLVIMPAILLILLWLATAYFLASLFKVSMKQKPVMLVSLSFVAVYLLGIKHTASSLYWPSGALSYQTANILLMFSLGLIIRLLDSQKQREKYSSVLATLLLFIILGIGTNETNILALTALIALTFVIKLRSGWEIVRPWVVILGVTLICFAIVYFAPGNTIRESTFPLKHDLPRAIKGSLDMGLWVLVGWILNPLFIVASMLTPFALSRLVQLSSRTFTVSKSLLWIFISITLLIPFVLQFPAWWAMGGWPPPRTVDAIFFVFIISWFSTLGVASIRYQPITHLTGNIKEYSPRVALIVLAGSILYSLSVFTDFKYQRAQTDLWQRAKPFHDYMLERYSLIGKALSAKHYSLLLPAFNREYPRSIYFNDIVPDPRDWRNICYADYFGLQQVSRERQQRKTGHKIKKIRPPVDGYSLPK